MELIERAFREMYPNREFFYDAQIKYSGKFSPYNANVKLRGTHLVVCLSKTWRGVDKEILVGLIQDLLFKILGGKRDTMNIQLYNGFVKNLHIGIAKTELDPYLLRSFERVNEKFFLNQMESPNLCWGSLSRRKLACYNYHTDTISVSTIFKECDVELLDYVMYHEMLHKAMKFQVSGNQHRYHTTDFRTAEKAYPNSRELEQRIRNLPFKRKQRSILGWFLQ
ncbi:MAG: hypothetical protein WC471_01085 [Candidatus Woesearchaeota archaeon]